MNEDLINRINYIVLNQLESLSNEELNALKQMLLFLDYNYGEETKVK